MKEIKIEIHGNDILIPTKENEYDAGADLRSSHDTLIKAHSTTLVPTGVCIELPEWYEAQVRPRSGLSIRGMFGTKEVPHRDANGELVCRTYNFIDAHVCIGTIDTGYKQEINVIVHNSGDSTFFIPAFTRIAQLVISKHEPYQFVKVDKLSNDNDRGGGLGHSGVE